jgi:hypothetical protein
LRLGDPPENHHFLPLHGLPERRTIPPLYGIAPEISLLNTLSLTRSSSLTQSQVSRIGNDQIADH